MPRFRFHLFTALVLMLLAGVLIHANLRPNRFPRVQHELEYWEQERYTGWVVLECNLRFEHGWPFRFHAFESAIENRQEKMPFEPAQDARALADFPRSEIERNLLTKSGLEGAGDTLTWTWREYIPARRLPRGSATESGGHVHSWNMQFLIMNIAAGLGLLLIAGAVLEFLQRGLERRRALSS